MKKRQRESESIRKTPKSGGRTYRYRSPRNGTMTKIFTAFLPARETSSLFSPSLIPVGRADARPLTFSRAWASSRTPGSRSLRPGTSRPRGRPLTSSQQPRRLHPRGRRRPADTPRPRCSWRSLSADCGLHIPQRRGSLLAGCGLLTRRAAALAGLAGLLMRHVDGWGERYSEVLEGRERARAAK